MVRDRDHTATNTASPGLGVMIGVPTENHQELYHDTAVAPGTAADLFALEFGRDRPTLLWLDLIIPALEFTAASGGEAHLVLRTPTNSRESSLPLVLGRAHTTGPAAWPLQISRSVELEPRSPTLSVSLAAITGTVVAHAGGDYGPLHLHSRWTVVR